jgi:hypothetical protein
MYIDTLVTTTHNSFVNSKRKGTLAVGEAIAYFIAKEETVLISISDCNKYDLVINKDGIFKRIQK